MPLENAFFHGIQCTKCKFIEFFIHKSIAQKSVRLLYFIGYITHENFFSLFSRFKVTRPHMVYRMTTMKQALFHQLSSNEKNIVWIFCCLFEKFHYNHNNVTRVFRQIKSNSNPNRLILYCTWIMVMSPRVLTLLLTLEVKRELPRTDER